MNRRHGLPGNIEHSIIQKQPLLWVNENWRPVRDVTAKLSVQLSDVYAAEARLQRFASLLMRLFPELVPSQGIIESALQPARAFQLAIAGKCRRQGRWFIKCDHALPVAGSIKARGGLYEVLLHAETLAFQYGLMTQDTDRVILATSKARVLFGKHRVSVGSTGNLGMSIGVIAAALGFRATVHMSSEAKEWKKARLRVHGVEVVEHSGDFGAAVAAGRKQIAGVPNAYFVDDENSKHLFLGYSVAALRLNQQLVEQGVHVDAEHPLFVYLPCGVGGAPGGITFGLRHLVGDAVHCFFAEPVSSPCMLIRLATPDNRPLSVRAFGLDNCTEADGLAVAQASEFVAPLMRSLVSGVFTVPDEDLFADLYTLQQSEGMRIEPSAAAGFRGPLWLLSSEQGRQYLIKHGVSEHMDRATHILWTTGGAFLPNSEYCQFYERGRVESTQQCNQPWSEP